MAARAAVVLVVAAALPGCLVDVDYSGTRFLCSASDDCPGGLECRGGVCTDEPLPAIDAAVDAPVDAPVPVCGDGLCTEICSECPEDCGQCPAGMVLRWTFDEPAGSAAFDVSGSGLDGVLESAARVPGLRGGALQFDDTADRVVLETAPMSLKPTAAVALAVWIQSPFTSDGEVVSLGDSYAIRAMLGGDARIFAYDGMDWTGSTTTGAALADGQWHHVVGQFTGTALEVYIDGALAQSVAYAIPIDYSLGPSLVAGKHGELNDSFDYVGLIDDVAIFDRALSPDEIAALAAER